ncbi:MAG: DUF58 domain-containing protein [Haloarculaceae archaeon]
MNRRRALVALGSLAVVAGLGLTVGPVSVPGGWVATVFLVGVWVAALGGAALVVVDRLTEPGEDGANGALPRVGDRPVYGVPGDRLAERVEAVGASERDAPERDRIRDRVRAATVGVLARRTGDSETTVRRRVAEGTWTDDGDAAALFADRKSRHDHVESGFPGRVERAIEAVASASRDGGRAADGERAEGRRSNGEGDGADPGRGRDQRDSTADPDGGETAGAIDPVQGVPGPSTNLARGESRVVRTGRWRGVQALALAGAAVGVLLGSPPAVLAGLAGVGFSAYARFWDAPASELSVERRVDETDPAPGERVRVTLSVRNEGDRLLPDVRLCDEVPPGLAVVDGTARHTTALRPGKTATISYEVAAVRGEHAFDALTVVTRDPSGASRRVTRVPTDPVTVTCRPGYGERSVGLGDLATLLAGRYEVAETGAGVAFHSVREYRHGDPLGCIDWTRLAKTGELASRRYDQPRTVRVVLLVDARRPAYVTGDPGERRPAVDAAAWTAGSLAAGLLDGGAEVGLAALSPSECWVEPGTGETHRRRLLDRVTRHEAFDWDPPVPRDVSTVPDGVQAFTSAPAFGPGSEPSGAGDGDPDREPRQTDDADRELHQTDDVDRTDGRPNDADRTDDAGGRGDRATARLAGRRPAPDGGGDGPRAAARDALDGVLGRFPGNAQVVFLSPLADDVAVAVPRLLAAHGHDVVVASPDVTGADTPYRRLAATERRLRVDALRRSRIPVHEWTPAVEPHEPGWSP